MWIPFCKHYKSIALYFLGDAVNTGINRIWESYRDSKVFTPKGRRDEPFRYSTSRALVTPSLFSFTFSRGFSGCRPFLKIYQAMQPSTHLGSSKETPHVFLHGIAHASLACSPAFKTSNHRRPSVSGGFLNHTHSEEPTCAFPIHHWTWPL